MLVKEGEYPLSPFWKPFITCAGYLFALEVGDTICFLPKEHHYLLKETEEEVASGPKKRKRAGDEAEVDVKPPAAKKVHLTEQQKKQEEEDMKLALSLQPRECTLCLENIDVDFLQSLQCGCVISIISTISSSSSFDYPKTATKKTNENFRHEFCRDCLVEYFKVNIESRELPLTCPELDCRKQVSDNGILKFSKYFLIFHRSPTPNSAGVIPKIRKFYIDRFDRKEFEGLQLLSNPEL